MTNLIFKAEDFAGLPFPIHKADPNKSLFKQIPELRQIREFTDCANPDVDKIVKYIILMYAKNSPLVKKFTDLGIRKSTAADMAGFEADAAILPTLYEFIDIEISNMVIGFLRFQNDLVFAMLASNEQTFYEYQQTLMSQMLMIRNDKDKITALAVKSKLMDDSDIIAARIDKYYKQLYIDDKAIDYVKKRSSSPESIAIQ